MLRKQTALSAFSLLLQQWGGEEEREARRYVVHNDFEFGEKDGLDYLRDDHRKKVEAVLALCDRTSFLALKVPKTEKDIVEFVGLPMFQIWKKTKNFIKARRKRVSKTEEWKPGTYMYHFEQFIKENRQKLEKMSPPKEQQVTKQEPIKKA